MEAKQYNETGNDGITLKYQGGSVKINGTDFNTSFTMNIECDADVTGLPD